jgi:pyruvate formate lyase activating enzyme
VAYTYNDPVIFLEYAVDVAEACRERGVRNVAVSAGYIAPEARREFFAPMDAANIDLKAFTEGFYKRLCSAQLRPVLDTLAYLKNETDVWLEITTLLIPGENDGPGEVGALSDWVAENLGPDVPLHLTAFHPDYRMLDKPRTPARTLLEARRIAVSRGLRYVYTGNVHDEATQTTWCHGCGAALIGRDWHEITGWGLTGDGRCGRCGEACPGVFDGPARRLGPAAPAAGAEPGRGSRVTARPAGCRGSPRRDPGRAVAGVLPRAGRPPPDDRARTAVPAVAARASPGRTA